MEPLPPKRAKKDQQNAAGSMRLVIIFLLNCFLSAFPPTLFSVSFSHTFNFIKSASLILAYDLICALIWVEASLSNNHNNHMLTALQMCSHLEVVTAATAAKSSVTHTQEGLTNPGSA